MKRLLNKLTQNQKKRWATFSFKSTVSIEGCWMVGLTSLEVYKSDLNITEENNKFKLYELSDIKNDEGRYESVRIDVAEKFANFRYHFPRSTR